MEHAPSPAALAARIAARQDDLAGAVTELAGELRPAALADRARASIRAEVHRVAHDGSGRLSAPMLAVLAGVAVAVAGLIVFRVVKR